MPRQDLVEQFRAIENRDTEPEPTLDSRAFKDEDGVELHVHIEDKEYSGELVDGIPGVVLRVPDVWDCAAFSPSREQLRELARLLTEYSEAWDAVAEGET